MIVIPPNNPDRPSYCVIPSILPTKPPVISLLLEILKLLTSQFEIDTCPYTLPAKPPVAKLVISFFPRSTKFVNNSYKSKDSNPKNSKSSSSILPTRLPIPPTIAEISVVVSLTLSALLSIFTLSRWILDTVTGCLELTYFSRSLAIVPKKPTPKFFCISNSLPWTTLIFEIVTGLLESIFNWPNIVPENISGSQLLSSLSEFTPVLDKSISLKII